MKKPACNSCIFKQASSESNFMTAAAAKSITVCPPKLRLNQCLDLSRVDGHAWHIQCHFVIHLLQQLSFNIVACIASLLLQATFLYYWVNNMFCRRGQSQTIWHFLSLCMFTVCSATLSKVNSQAAPAPDSIATTLADGNVLISSNDQSE